MKKLRIGTIILGCHQKNTLMHSIIFLIQKLSFNKNTQILDIGCGRANIISALQKKYKFNNKPIGIDVVKNRNIKKNVIL